MVQLNLICLISLIVIYIYFNKILKRQVCHMYHEVCTHYTCVPWLKVVRQISSKKHINIVITPWGMFRHVTICEIDGIKRVQSPKHDHNGDTIIGHQENTTFVEKSTCYVIKCFVFHLYNEFSVQILYTCSNAFVSLACYDMCIKGHLKGSEGQCYYL
jgi:hypothetical protein